jgi:hypothetical protein
LWGEFIIDNYLAFNSNDFLVIFASLFLGILLIKKYSKKILIFSFLFYISGVLADGISTFWAFETFSYAFVYERNPIINNLYPEWGSLSAFAVLFQPEYILISMGIFILTFIPLFTVAKLTGEDDKKILPVTLFSLGLMRFFVAIGNFLIFLKI